jgi:hypothetical protein
MPSRVMHMVAEATYAADGLTVVYGAGELHPPGSLPEGVPYREVLASEEFAATAPPASEPPPPPAPPAKSEHPAGKAAGKT